MRTADAGNIDSYKGAVPADVVIMVGVLGNISDADVERTIKTAAQLCFPGTTLLWSRSPGDGDDRNDAVRSGFTAAGFVELDSIRSRATSAEVRVDRVVGHVRDHDLLSRAARRLSLMASRPHTIELKPDAFELVSREAERRGVSPDQVVEEIIRTDLAVVHGGDLDAALRRAATLRSTLPRLDGVVLAREARADLQARGA